MHARLVWRLQRSACCAAKRSCSSNAAFGVLEAALRDKRVPYTAPQRFVDAVLQLTPHERIALSHQISHLVSNGDLPHTLYALLRGALGGVKAAMHLRDAVQAQTEGSEKLDTILRVWLGTAFAVDMLQLRRITFENSSGEVLEHISRGDAVHRVRSLAELKRRVGPGRRVFGLFHNAQSHTPLTFVNVALVPEMAPSLAYIDENVQSVPEPACAVFYSITSSFEALSGLDLAAHLIKSACVELQSSHPSVETFCTLSPMPGFLRWLSTLPSSVLLPHEAQHLSELLGSSLTEAFEALKHVLFADPPLWSASLEHDMVLKPILLRLAAQYLTQARNPAQRPLDPVQRFHIRNGASLRRINWKGSLSGKMLRESAGIMVNYLYELEHVANRHEEHLHSGEIPVHEEVLQQLHMHK